MATIDSWIDFMFLGAVSEEILDMKRRCLKEIQPKVHNNV